LTLAVSHLLFLQFALIVPAEGLFCLGLRGVVFVAALRSGRLGRVATKSISSDNSFGNIEMLLQLFLKEPLYDWDFSFGRYTAQTAKVLYTPVEG